ncbi:VOC family protein [Plantactinospora sp. GCM10030261]|uniref:VOC family protein n=1 Tax=Plantactinospora sp. GCM10030261 TaxID=3273420 RepID=UPI00360DE575
MCPNRRSSSACLRVDRGAVDGQRCRPRGGAGCRGRHSPALPTVRRRPIRQKPSSERFHGLRKRRPCHCLEPVDLFTADGARLGELGYNLGFQTEPHYVRPVWPTVPGQPRMSMHLDIEVDDLAQAVAYAVGIGAEVAAY